MSSPRITLHTFRRVGRQEEAMIRATMPRTSARDAAPLEPFAGNRASTARRTFTLTYTLAEVARG